MKKIAVMGGTFNPIHIGHLIMAEHVYNTGEYDEILFLPSGQPPHKTKGGLLSKEVRYTLCELSIAGNNHFQLSDIELKREGYSYTVETVGALKELNPSSDYSWIIGTDTLLDLYKWYKPEVLLSVLKFIVVDRNSNNQGTVEEEIKRLKGLFPQSDIRYLPMPLVDISSTTIRSKIASGESVRYMLSEAAYEYIVAHGLYMEEIE